MVLGYTQIQAQDIVHLNDGSSVECHIIEISDFILYAEVYNEPDPITFFSDDVSYLDIDPKNSWVIRQLKNGVKDAMDFTNPLEDNSLYGFYFGMPYDSVDVAPSNSPLFERDSLGNPILVPYDPLETTFSDRLKSLAKSFGSNSLAWIVGL